jgi:hypothetical protein
VAIAALAVGAAAAGPLGVAVVAVRAVFLALWALLTLALDAVAIATLVIGAAAASALPVAIVSVRAVLVAWRAAMTVCAVLIAALFVGAALVDISVVTVVALWAVLGERSACSSEAVIAGFQAIGIDCAAIVEIDAPVAFARLADPAITGVHALDAEGVRGITRVVANRLVNRAVAAVTALRARATLRRAAELACRAAAFDDFA